MSHKFKKISNTRRFYLDKSCKYCLKRFWDVLWRYEDSANNAVVAFKNKKVVGFYYRDSGDTREEGVLKGLFCPY